MVIKSNFALYAVLGYLKATEYTGLHDAKRVGGTIVNKAPTTHFCTQDNWWVNPAMLKYLSCLQLLPGHYVLRMCRLVSESQKSVDASGKVIAELLLSIKTSLH